MISSLKISHKHSAVISNLSTAALCATMLIFYLVAVIRVFKNHTIVFSYYAIYSSLFFSAVGRYNIAVGHYNI
jgi:hypothetical protein